MKNRMLSWWPARLSPSPVSLILLCSLLASLASAAPAVVLNEIHYHPVENAAFTPEGLPVLDLSEDVHEFVELFNNGPTNVSLAGWRLSGEIDYAFSNNAVIVPGRYLVIAKNPARLRAITQYNSLNETNLLGPYQGQLSNGGGTLRLVDVRGEAVDSVSYSAKFPWAIGADALGADDEWTGLKSTNYQYRGRSLERVSATWPGNDPGNWLASPVGGNPSPGRVNTVVRAVPRPVVTSYAAYGATNGAALIRSNQTVHIDCAFSATNQLSAVSVEYFVDDINITNEARSTISMSSTGAPSAGRFTAVLPGQAERRVVRYRIRANRGNGVEPVSPRADDPFAWHAYFVTPQRATTNRVYDCFISSASLNTLATNLNPANPAGVDTAVLRRITTPNPPGKPSPYWNATEPAILVADGEVYDARARYHGSQYRRTPGNNSWKWQFPRYQKLDEREGVFISDNDDITVVCNALYRLGGIPQSYNKWIDFYLNSAPLIVRMDQDEMDDSLMDRFQAAQRLASPGLPHEGSGEFYKAQGNFLFSDPTGPFGYGGYRILPALPPYWTELQRYENTYGLQMHGWKGYVPFLEALHGLWTARGDSPTAVNPNTNALRAWLLANFDVETTLTSMAIRVWCGGWDNFNHNTFLWRRENGRWSILQWDFDAELADPTSTIYLSEYGAPLINTQFGGTPKWVDANWINDSFFKAFREDYKRKLWLLNNTLLNPTNITALGFGSFRSYADARFGSVNSQLGLGAFQRPRTPTNMAPAYGQAALAPAVLQTSPYLHTANPPTPHLATTWIIRSAAGSFSMPVFKTTSTSNLTSLPIPFGSLTFGETYYWQAFYTDTNGHPSLPSTETQFIYGASPTLVPVIPLDAGTLWRYNQGGTNPPLNWKTLNFDDSAWPEGAALLADDAGPLPEPIRTPLTRGNKITFYFRKAFNFTGDPAQSYLRLRHVVDDGVVIYLNGAEIVRTGMSSSTVSNSTLAVRGIVNAMYEGPFIIFPTNLLSGTNVLAAEVHRNSGGSPDVVFGLTLEASFPPMPGNIVLNEIMADNRGAVANGGEYPDYIELYNRTDLPQNLNGLSLSDDVTRPGRFIFPPNVTIGPHGYLMVWCDNETNAPGLHTGFGLDNDGQTVALFTASTNGYQLGDTLTFGLQIPNYSIGRAAPDSSDWALTYATPAAENVAAPTAPATGLKINEWMASDAGGPDWLELFNPADAPVALGGLALSDDLIDPGKSPLAPLSFVAPAGFRQLIADQDPGASARHVNFKLSGTGEAIVLRDAAYSLIDAIFFGPQASGVSEGRLPDGAETIRPFPDSASPESSNYLPVDNVLVNEVLAHSDPPFEDAVEFFNPSDLPADVGGWWLSDDLSNLRKFQLPSPTVIPAGQFLVIYENQFNADPNDPNSFAFSSARGDAIYLSAIDGAGALTGYRATAHFDASETNVSIGRFATSQGIEFGALSTRSFGSDHPATVEGFRTGTGAPNAGPKVGPVVISEILFHPPDLAGGVDNGRDEFIELRNISGSPVPLFDPVAPTNRWRLRDAVDYTFPPGIALAPNETVLVVSFDPLTNAPALAGFVETYGTLPVRLFGPYSGKLDNSGDSIELVKPAAPVGELGPDYGFVATILVDRVHYADVYPWPDTADGTGQSLMRIVSNSYGNDPTNWFAWVPTPGSSNFYNALPLVTLTAPDSGAVFLGPTNILLTATAHDPDGTIARVEFFDGTNKLAQFAGTPYQFLWTNAAFGPHTLTARARDNGNAPASSAPVEIRVNSRPPTIALTSPAANALFLSTNVISLAALASDPDTPISKVEFFVDDAKVSEDLTAPYIATWSAVPGAHGLTAVATDSSGVSSTSAVVNIFVQTVAISSSTVVPANSIWSYLDTGVNLGTAWTNLDFADAAWASGPAELGYGDGDEATIISFGPISTAKYITTYFRLRFVLSSVTDISRATLSVLRDDGAIAYLNGVEVYRGNMPASVNYLTGALVALNPPEESTFYPTNVPPARFVVGTNILAVEVHQQSGTSSDVSFAATLEIGRMALGPAILIQPQPRTNVVGESAQFNVVASGSAPLNYQWRFNGNPISGETSDTLVLPNAQLAQAGDYSVTVSNAIAAVTSASATLSFSEVDSDGDGLPDSWELAYGLDPLDEFDAFEDADGDGADNWSEYIAGTNPTNRLSYLKIDSLGFGQAAVLTFVAAANTTYSVQFTETLGQGGWKELTSIRGGPVESIRTVVDPAAGLGRFYRLSVAQQPQTPLRIQAVAVAPAATVSFFAVSNRTYTVEFSDAPTGQPWLRAGDVPARATNRIVTVGHPGNSTSRFYRVVTPAKP